MLRHVVIVPALYAIAPALASQVVIIMLTTSIVSTISADELTSITNGLQSETFRPFEFYLAASAIYVAMALSLRSLMAFLVSHY